MNAMFDNFTPSQVNNDYNEATRATKQIFRRSKVFKEGDLFKAM